MAIDVRRVARLLSAMVIPSNVDNISPIESSTTKILSGSGDNSRASRRAPVQGDGGLSSQPDASRIMRRLQRRQRLR